MSHYLSDCRSVYNVKAGEGYPSMQLACRNCQTPSEYFTKPCIGYTMGGNCSNAVALQDGRGYISDGVNYFYMPVHNNNNYPSASMACTNGISHLNGYPISGSCTQNMNFSSPSVEHFEPPSEYKPNGNNNNRLHLTLIIILLFILIVLISVFLVLKINKKI